MLPLAWKGWRQVGEFKLSEIDFDALVAVYFWDTDFLIAPIPGANRQPEELPIVPIEPTLWSDNRSDNSLFTPASLRYPDWEEA